MSRRWKVEGKEYREYKEENLIGRRGEKKERRSEGRGRGSTGGTGF